MMTYRTYRTWPFSVRCAPNLSSQPRGFTQELYQRPPATPGLRARVGGARRGFRQPKTLGRSAAGRTRWTRRYTAVALMADPQAEQ